MQHYRDVVQDRSGNVIGGAIVTVIDHSSGQSAPLYSDANGSVPLTSVITDTNGTFSFYVASGRYDITVSKNGIVLSSVSDVFITVTADYPTAMSEADATAGISTLPQTISASVLQTQKPTAMDSATAQAGTSTTAQTVSASVLKAGIDANDNVVKTYSSVSAIPTNFVGTARVGTDLYVADGATVANITQKTCRVGFVGDSITAMSYIFGSSFGLATRGFGATALQFASNKVDLAGYMAVGGYTVEQIQSLVSTNVPKNQADYIVCLAGTNLTTAYGASTTSSQLIAALENLWETIKSKNATIIYCTIPPNNSGSGGIDFDGLISVVNNYIRNKVSTGAYVFDLYKVLSSNTPTSISGTVSAWRPNMSDAAGVHPNTLGAYFAGYELSKLLVTLPGRKNILSTFTNIDPYVINANPSIYGGGGTGVSLASNSQNAFNYGDANVTGNGPYNSYFYGSYGAAASCVCSLASSTATDTSRDYNEFQMVITPNVAGSIVKFFGQQGTITTRAASTNYYFGAMVVPAASTGFMYKNITNSAASTSAGASSTIAWPTVIGNTVIDGGVRWLCCPLLQDGVKIQASCEVSIAGLTSGSVTPNFFVQVQSGGGTGAPLSVMNFGTELINNANNLLNNGALDTSNNGIVQAIANTSDQTTKWTSVPSGYFRYESPIIKVNKGGLSDVNYFGGDFRLEIGASTSVLTVKIRGFEIRIIP